MGDSEKHRPIGCKARTFENDAPRVENMASWFLLDSIRSTCIERWEYDDLHDALAEPMFINQLCMLLNHVTRHGETEYSASPISFDSSVFLSHSRIP